MNEIAEEIRDIIKPSTTIMADLIVKNNCLKVGIDPDKLSKKDLEKLLPEIIKGVRFFSSSREQTEEIEKELKEKMSSIED
jgi:hypothetical protein